MSHVKLMRALGVVDEDVLGSAAVLDMKEAARDAEEHSEVTRLRAELRESRKDNADLRAEYMLVESALVDAMGALQFYADPLYWAPPLLAPPSDRAPLSIHAEARFDAGKRARVLLDRIFDRLVAFAHIQKLKG